MNIKETPTPRTDAWWKDYCENESPVGTPSALVFARTLERELEDMRSAFDKQCSVTLGQMQTIRELRADRDSWEQQARENAELAITTGKQRDAWREVARRLADLLHKVHPYPNEEPLAAYYALVAKEGGK